MGTARKQDWRQVRRYRAWKLKQQGWKQKASPQALGANDSAVSQWLKRGREHGVTALKSYPGPSPQPKLTNEQREQLRVLVAQGAPAHGYHEAVWTSRRVADLMQHTFGVTYHRVHCRWLLRTLGQRVQKPVVRASQRDEAAIVPWRDERWHARKNRRRGRTDHRLRR